jgi:hypothetical protein
MFIILEIIKGEYIIIKIITIIILNNLIINRYKSNKSKREEEY